MNNPKTLTEFLSRRKSCEGCATKKLYCVPYQLLFLDIINEKQFTECPCTSCIVKVVCEECCGEFDTFIDKHFVVVSSQSLPAIEHIVNFYRKVNAHLLKFQVDVYNMTRISDVYYSQKRKLNSDEEERVRNVSKRFRKQTYTC